MTFALLVMGCAKPSPPHDAAVPNDAEPPRTGEVNASPEASPTPAPPPFANGDERIWCDEQYSEVPCVFRAYGQCLRRDCVEDGCQDTGYALVYCPLGDPPAFMNQTMVCGRLPDEPVVPQKSSNSDEAECHDRETRWANVTHDDRTCETDADCTTVTGNCFDAPLNVAAAQRPEMQEVTCGDPLAGACPPSEARAKCQNGCCVDAQFGAFGTTSPVYPRVTPP